MSVKLSKKLEREQEFERVTGWLARWGFSLVNSDGEPIAETYQDRLKTFYASEHTWQ